MFTIVYACPSYWGMDNNCHGIVANVLVSDPPKLCLLRIEKHPPNSPCDSVVDEPQLN
jgi:hypothetical protein